MRAGFAEQLDELRGILVVTAASVTSAIRWATDSLLHTDIDAAAKVTQTAVEVKAARVRVDELIQNLLVRQQPVASDLRLALAGLHVAADLDRMGALAEHIAKIVILRYPEPVAPPEMQEVLRSMGHKAEELAWSVTRALETDDPHAAAQLDRDDDVIDTLRGAMFEVLFNHWAHGVKAAVDLALIGRYYERYADHAVATGEQVVFLVTGTMPQR